MLFVVFLGFLRCCFCCFLNVLRDFCPGFWCLFLQLGWSIVPSGYYTLDRVAAFAASPLRAGGVAKTRVLAIFDASFIAGFGLAPDWRV